MKTLTRKQLLVLFGWGLALSLAYVGFTQARQPNACQTILTTMAGSQFQKGGCIGPWEIKINNKEELATAIDDYIKEKRPRSRFLEINNGAPGIVFVNAAVQNQINPLILLGAAEAESTMATSNGADMACGNPFGQKAGSGQPSCGDNWYEYNPQHAFNEAMLFDQAARVKRVYVDDPTIVTFDDYLEKYTPLADNPDRDTPASQCGAKPACGVRDNYLTTMQAIIDGAGEAITCGPDLSNLNLPDAVKARIIENLTVYKTVAANTNVPWEALAAIHYREGSNAKNASLLNGRALCNNDDGSRCSACNNGATLINDATCAALHLQGKVGNRLTQTMSDDELIKDAFWGYNGRAYGSADNSPYVMNMYDAAHMNMPIITRDHGPIDGIDTRFGAFTIYKMLKGGL